MYSKSKNAHLPNLISILHYNEVIFNENILVHRICRTYPEIYPQFIPNLWISCENGVERLIFFYQIIDTGVLSIYNPMATIKRIVSLKKEQ